MDSASRSAHNDAHHSRYNHGHRPIQSEQAVTSPPPTTTAITSNVNTKLRPITSKLPSNQVAHDPLKLTLIQTNGHPFVANKYPDSFSTHFNRWPNAAQSPPYDIKWKTAHNPFASHFNPSIETIPVSAAADAATPYRPPQHLPSSSTVLPTVNVYRMYTDHRVHVHKHHTGHGYVSQSLVVVVVFSFSHFHLYRNCHSIFTRGQKNRLREAHNDSGRGGWGGWKKEERAGKKHSNHAAVAHISAFEFLPCNLIKSIEFIQSKNS